MGYVAQDYALFPASRRVGENVAFGLRASGRLGERIARADEARARALRHRGARRAPAGTALGRAAAARGAGARAGARSRACCCSTSRCPRWICVTRRAVRGELRRTAARRCPASRCTSPTSRSRRCSSATGSWCWSGAASPRPGRGTSCCGIRARATWRSWWEPTCSPGARAGRLAGSVRTAEGELPVTGVAGRGSVPDGGSPGDHPLPRPAGGSAQNCSPARSWSSCPSHRRGSGCAWRWAPGRRSSRK